MNFVFKNLPKLGLSIGLGLGLGFGLKTTLINKVGAAWKNALNLYKNNEIKRYPSSPFICEVGQ